MNRKAVLIVPLLMVVAVSVLAMPAVACGDTTPPVIEDVYQQPDKDSVYPDNQVEVYANVTDNPCGSGIKQVILNYTNGNGTWIPVNMTNLEGKTWNGTIRAFPYCTNVTYVIMAEDKAGNSITTEEMGYTYQYHVVPEFPSLLILPPFMFLALIAVALAKKIRRKVVAKTT